MFDRQVIIKGLMYAIAAYLAMHLWQGWKMQQTPAAKAPSLVTKTVGGHKLARVSLKGAMVLENDVVRAYIRPKGGTVIATELKDYKKTLKGAQDVQLVNQQKEPYIAVRSGVTGDQFVTFYASKNTRKMGANGGKVSLTLFGEKNGVRIKKTMSLVKGAFDVQQKLRVENKSDKIWKGHHYLQIQQMLPEEKGKSMLQMNTYTGLAYYTKNKPYVKAKFSNLKKTPVNYHGTGGWIATQKRYFITALAGDPNQRYHTFSEYDADEDIYSLSMLSKTLILEPGESVSLGQQMYSGPEIVKNLEKVAPGLSLTIDYGWLWMISELLFKVLLWLQQYVHNWGVAIILLTILIKGVFYHLSAKSYRSMGRMKKLQPKIQALQQKYANDKEKLGRETMAFYKKEKINPLGGCLPMLVQIPFFIALYWVLMESVQLRHAPFFFWIHDLSVKDPFYVLPVLMGISMLVQQKISPAPQDPQQAKIMMIMPLVFTFMFLRFPAGLVLYWLTNNILSVTQQWWMMSRENDKARA